MHKEGVKREGDCNRYAILMFLLICVGSDYNPLYLLNGLLKMTTCWRIWMCSVDHLKGLDGSQWGVMHGPEVM